MKTLRKTGFQIKAIDDAGKGTAVIATLNVVDSDGDVTLPGAFGAQLAKMIPAHDWSHVPLGKAQIREDGNNVLADFEMNLEIEDAMDWYRALKFDMEKGKPLMEWSYGFTIIKESFGEHNGQDVRFLEGLKVHEISPVVAGAGVDTRTVDIKSDGPWNGPEDMLQIKSDQVAGRSVKLSDQLRLALWDVEAVIKRCKEVREIRERDGRDLSPERYAELGSLMLRFAVLEEIGKSMYELLQKGEDPEVLELLSNEFARAEFLSGA